MFYRSSLNGIVSLKKKSLNGIAAVHMPLRYNAPIVEQLPSMAVVSLSERVAHGGDTAEDLKGKDLGDLSNVSCTAPP
jgi:hypothetical protein